MKKLLVAVVAVLLAWNTWLTIEFLNHSNAVPKLEEKTDESTVVEENVTSITTDLTEIAENAQPSIVGVNAVVNETQRNGSGFIYSSSGNDCWIVTSADLLSDESIITVRFDNGVEVEAQLAGKDNATDIALLLAHPEFDTTALKLGDSDLIHQGEYVIALSSRQPEIQSSSISFGVVSLPMQLLRNYEEEPDWITNTLITDVSLPRMATGGPLLNLSGNVVGMMSTSLSSVSGYAGMNTAVTSAEIIHVCEQIKNTGKVTRGYLGVIGRDVTELKIYEKSAMNLTLDTNTGVVCTFVAEDSIANTINMSKGDVITAMDGIEIDSLSQLYDRLYQHGAADEVILTVKNQGNSYDIGVTLE